MEAPLEGHIEVARLLINQGTDIYAKDNTGNTALNIANKKGHTEIISLIQKSQQVKVEDLAALTSKLNSLSKKI